MKIVVLIIGLIITNFTLLFSQESNEDNYFNSSSFKQVERDLLVQARDFVEKREEYKAFYPLSLVIEDKESLKEDISYALALRGWLNYLYQHWEEAIQDWERYRQLVGNSEEKRWVDLPLSWLYLVTKNHLASRNIFYKALGSDKYPSLYHVLRSRLSLFTLPLNSQELPYINYVTYLKATERGVYLGNLYGGLVYFDNAYSKIREIEPAYPSLKGNGISSIVILEDGIYLAKRNGLYYKSNNGSKSELLKNPIAGVDYPLVKEMILYKDNLIVLFAQKGIWSYNITEESWACLVEKVEERSFLINFQNSLLFLQKNGGLGSFDLSSREFKKFYSLTVEYPFFPIQSIQEGSYWIANSAGKVWHLFWKDNDWIIQEINISDENLKKEVWLAFWLSQDETLNYVQAGIWKKYLPTGEYSKEIKFPLPILSNLIHQQSYGGGYIYFHIGSEVYALDENLLF